MNFSIPREILLKGLSLTQGVVEKRNTMPILSNILLEAQKGENLHLTATDLEVGMTSFFPAQVKTPGKITLNARNLVEITRQLPNENISFLALPNHVVEIVCGRSRFKLNGLPAEDFPSLPQVEQKTTFQFPAKELAVMIDHTSFSISTDEARYNLSGVYVEQVEAGKLRLVSSDGHRLSLIDREIPDAKVTFKDAVIIPRKGLMEIRRLCGEVDGNVEISLSKNNCSVKHENTRLVIRLIDGEFPEYRQVLPDEAAQKVVAIDRQTLLGALRRISILSQEKTKGVRFQFENNALKITVNNPDLGEGEEEVEIKYDQATLEIGFNAKYFLDVLNIITTDQIELLVGDSMTQGLIRPYNDKSFKAIVMPMKLL